MKAAKAKMFTGDESRIYFCAFRYCLGLRNYVVSIFHDEATRKIRKITDHYLLLMEKELQEAINKDLKQREKGESYKILGGNVERDNWARFSKIVSNEIDRRKLEHWIPIKR